MLGGTAWLWSREERPTPWTSCSSTKRGRCRSPTSSPSRRRPTASCCSAIRSSSISRRRRRIRTAWASRRSSTCWAAPRRCPRIAGSSCRLPAGCRRRSRAFTSELFYEGKLHARAGLAAGARRHGGLRRPGCGWCRCSTTAIRTLAEEVDAVGGSRGDAARSRVDAAAPGEPRVADAGPRWIDQHGVVRIRSPGATSRWWRHSTRR